MIKPSAKVTGFEEVKSDLSLAEQSVRRRLYSAIESTASQVESLTRSNLSGGVLNPRTGRTLAGLKTVYSQRPDSVSARVGTDWYVGRFWERGFASQQSVRAHLRAIQGGERMELVKLKGRRKVKTEVTRVYETGATQVSAYERTVNGTARPFLQPALSAAMPTFRAALADIQRSPTK